MTRISNTVEITGMPIRCSACFNQQQIRHVDFDAANDRGWYDESAQIAMDDLILCENCVKEGAELIGMVNAEAQAHEMADMRRKLEIKDKRLKQVERLNDTLEDLNSQRGVKVDHRKLPRKRIEEMV